MNTRRDFLRTTLSIGSAGILTGLTFDLLQAAETDSPIAFQPIKFGIIADMHRDMTPDADERLEAFMKKVDEEKPDFLMDLGDFAHPLPANEPFIQRFTSSKSPAYHVLGNHDLDAVDKKTAVAIFGMPAAYYSFDTCGYHCVVLDPNSVYSNGEFLDYDKGNYFSYPGKVGYVNDEQCDWLKDDLRKTDLPTFLFSHQGLVDNEGVNNRTQVRQILENENERCGYRKILACFNGHYHRDIHRTIHGIHYFDINSVSNDWHEEQISGRYPEEMEKKYPWLVNVVLHKDPLFCFVAIDASGKLSMRGVKSQWVVPHPQDEIGRASCRERVFQPV
jgi:hypothetical protein